MTLYVAVSGASIKSRDDSNAFLTAGQFPDVLRGCGAFFDGAFSDLLAEAFRVAGKDFVAAGFADGFFCADMALTSL